MNLKDIIIILLVICIFGIFIFGSVGSFIGHVDNFIDNFSNSAQSSHKQFTVDYFRRKSSDSSKILNENDIPNLSGSKGSSSSVVDGSNSSKSSGQNKTVNQNQSKNSTGNYENYQFDYKTDMVDLEGNPIIFSIVSTSGEIVDPGVYEVYWSKLGVINQTRIS